MFQSSNVPMFQCSNIPMFQCSKTTLTTRYGVGASRDPCSEVYKGSHPFSEAESRALRLTYIPHTRDQRLIVITTRDYLQSLTNVQAAISVHSFGNVLIYPWGYKVTIEDDVGIMVRAVRSIRKSNNRNIVNFGWKCGLEWITADQWIFLRSRSTGVKFPLLPLPTRWARQFSAGF